MSVLMFSITKRSILSANIRSYFHSSLRTMADSNNCDPTTQECDQRSRQFASITDTDEACAHLYLQDCDWDVQIAVNRYYLVNKQHVDRLSWKLLTWNLDGLDAMNLVARTEAVCSIIKQCEPDVVFLQEVVDKSRTIIKNGLSNHYILYPCFSSEPYFTAILLRVNRFIIISNQYREFPTSSMGRSLHQLKTVFAGHTVYLLNSHLESMSEHFKERKMQLTTCLNTFKTLAEKDEDLVIFAGDLNARDKEISSVGLPLNAKDAWEVCGSDKKQQYSWDCLQNDNLKSMNQFKPRCRFDRVFFNEKAPFKPVKFELIGKQRIRTSLCFPSDHWGVVVTFESIR